MKNCLSFVIAAALLAAATLSSAATAPPGAAAAIDELMSEYAAVDAFSGAILVADENGVVVQKAYGLAVREWDIANTVDTRFRIGSLSKQFTAALILRLAQQGQLDLDATLTSVLPWYRADTGSKVTVRHLLHHTSGIDRSGVMRMITESPAARISLREEVETYCSGDLETEPGATFAYNNGGYLILSAIVEEVSGQSYDAAFSKLILEPAELVNTGMDDSGKVIPRMACGYNRSGGTISRPRFVEPALASGAGGAYSTVGDMYLWDRALYSDVVLNAASRKLMFTPGKGGYGCGWLISSEPVGPDGADRTVISHPGQGDGFWSVVWRLPEDRVTVVLINNLGRTDLNSMAVGVLTAVYGGQPKVAVGPVMRDAIERSGVEAAVTLYRTLKKEQPGRYDFGEAQLNSLGYALLKEEAAEAAVAVLQLNVEAFPESANAHDSLAEAFEAVGQVERAVELYRKALEVDPSFTHAAERLSALGQQAK